MWMSEIAERAILDITSDITATKRASRVDDEPTEDKERAKYPAIAIMASGGTLTGSPDQAGAKFYDVPISVKLITHYTDDPKMTALAALEDSFRTVLDQGFQTEFDAIAAANGDEWHYSGLVEITGENVERMRDENSDRTTEISIITTMVLKVCGSIT